MAADFANRDDTHSIIRLNDAFWKTLPQAEKKSRALTDRGKQLISRALISNKFFSIARTELWKMIAGSGGRCWGGKGRRGGG